MVADACEEFGLKLAELSRETIGNIGPVLPPSTRISNPLDCFSAGVPPNVFDAYNIPLTSFMKDQKVDIVLSCFVVNRVWTVNADRLLNELKPFQKKPMAALVMGDYGRVREFTDILEGRGVPVFATPERAVRALGALWYHYALSREY